MDRYLQAVLVAIKAYEPNRDAEDYEFENAEIIDGEILLNIDGESIAITVEVV